MIWDCSRWAAGPNGSATADFQLSDHAVRVEQDGVVTKVVSKYDASSTKTVKRLLELERDDLK
jgi:hypothetical protein